MMVDGTDPVQLGNVAFNDFSGQIKLFFKKSNRRRGMDEERQEGRE